MPTDWRWYVVILAAYLVGAIPFGLLIGFARGVDIRTFGSGNIGATNTGRMLGRKWGLICFFLDVGKGLGPTLFGGWLFGYLGRGDLSAGACGAWLTVGVAALLGHIFPVYLRFKGGKGVATGFGVILGLWPFLTVPALGAMVTWFLFAGALRYVGVASVVSTAVLPGYYAVAAHVGGWSLERTWPFILVTGLMTLLVFVRHIGNLRRTVAGTEPRLGE